MNENDHNRPISLTEEELADLRIAKSKLETPGLTARLANKLGTPIERGFKLLPKDWMERVQKAAHASLLKALNLAVYSMDLQVAPRSSNRMHKILVGASGGIGGAIGLAALPVELPISTTLMLRSIADIAQSQGLNPRLIETRLACLEVFALGGKSTEDDAVENAYWVVRATLAKALAEATTFLAQRGVVEESAPAIVRLLGTIASRFGVIVSEEVAAKAIPVVGAATGSLINVMFMDHFQTMARGHFIVKRLEAKYGTEMIQELYRRIH